MHFIRNLKLHHFNTVDYAVPNGSEISASDDLCSLVVSLYVISIADILFIFFRQMVVALTCWIFQHTLFLYLINVLFLLYVYTTWFNRLPFWETGLYGWHLRIETCTGILSWMLRTAAVDLDLIAVGFIASLKNPWSA